MASPLVSIIIPTKNEEKNIGRLLESIDKQTYPNIEKIVVDVGSTDKTMDIARKFTNKVYKSGNERSAQRNFGAKKAKGKFLVFLDADMELTSRVIEDAVDIALRTNCKVLTIPERTVGTGFVARVRRFEREMYMGDPTIEVARFFSKEVFTEFGGYDVNLTGPEDYDLPYRMSKKYDTGRSNEYILHHEESLSLLRLLQKRYYYASQGASYAAKHPELVSKQGNLLFRKAYLRNWKKFLKEPVWGICFICVRILETIYATAGYISTVGILGFLRTVLRMFKK